MIEYALIQTFYRNKCAKRSKVPYINHINEGLIILDYIGADELSKRAFCLHPIIQDDETFNSNLKYLEGISWKVIVLVMEYRNVANRGLHCYQVDNPDKIYLGPCKEVHEMLTADKVQNRKDFEIHHSTTHPKAIELSIYFKNWLRALKITELEYNRMVDHIKSES